jgi:integrase
VLLRRARRRAESRVFTAGSAAGIRTRVRGALAFLAWLDTIQVPLADITQALVDRWLDEGATTRYALRPFLAWARDRRLAGEVEVPALPVGAPSTRHREQAQWQQLRRCLHDTALPLEVRVAGSMLLLFGIRASALVRIEAHDIEPSASGTHLRVAKQALLLPPVLATIVVQQRDRTDLRAALGRTRATGPRWLFPGGQPGQPLTANTLATKLNNRGINVRAARNTALADLAADLPPPVLADLVGIGLTTATRWAHQARRDWSPYVATRTPGPRPEGSRHRRAVHLPCRPAGRSGGREAKGAVCCYEATPGISSASSFSTRVRISSRIGTLHRALLAVTTRPL